MKTFVTSSPLLLASLAAALWLTPATVLAATEDYYTECEGSCVIDLGAINCTVALQKYEFSGNCCSLQPSPTGNCHLIITTGFCDYADKGYEQCMDDLEDHSSSEDHDEALCGNVHMFVAGKGTEDKECPTSKYTIPDPIHSQQQQSQQQQQQAAASTVTSNYPHEITIHAHLNFQFVAGQGRPPSDKEIASIIEETEAFFNDYLHEQQQDMVDLDGLWFEVENIRSHYDYAADEASLSFSLIFVCAEDARPENLADARDTLVRLVSTANLHGHMGQYILEMGPRDHHDVFRATEGISFRAMLA